MQLDSLRTTHTDSHSAQRPDSTPSARRHLWTFRTAYWTRSNRGLRSRIVSNSRCKCNWHSDYGYWLGANFRLRHRKFYLKSWILHDYLHHKHTTAANDIHHYFVNLLYIYFPDCRFVIHVLNLGTLRRVCFTYQPECSVPGMQTAFLSTYKLPHWNPRLFLFKSVFCFLRFFLIISVLLFILLLI